MKEQPEPVDSSLPLKPVLNQREVLELSKSNCIDIVDCFFKKHVLTPKENNDSNYGLEHRRVTNALTYLKNWIK